MAQVTTRTTTAGPHLLGVLVILASLTAALVAEVGPWEDPAAAVRPVPDEAGPRRCRSRRRRLPVRRPRSLTHRLPAAIRGP
jgi:hypothetical protein